MAHNHTLKSINLTDFGAQPEMSLPDSYNYNASERLEADFSMICAPFGKKLNFNIENAIY